MTAVLPLAAAALLIVGAAALYATMVHQRLLSSPLPRRARAAASVALVGALALLLALMGPATAVFTWVIGLMAIWTLLPLATGWLRYRRELQS